MTKMELEAMGYRCVSQVATGEWIGVYPFLYTCGLMVGLEEHGYRRRFCYERAKDAVIAAAVFDGIGDPPGPWIKEKGERGERLGPGAHE